MRFARRDNTVVHAYQLGAGSETERRLIQNGSIRVLPGNKYELFSLEATNGSGEIASAGDYFKVTVVNEKEYPYPNRKEYFEQNHTYIKDNLYRQASRPLAFWRFGDAKCDEIDFLVDSGRLIISENSQKFYTANLHGAKLSAPRDAYIVLYEICRDNDGIIHDIAFNFVAKDEFEANYRVISVTT